LTAPSVSGGGPAVQHQSLVAYLEAKEGKRAVQLLTVPVERQRERTDTNGELFTSQSECAKSGGHRNTTGKLRAILRAPELIQSAVPRRVGVPEDGGKDGAEVGSTVNPLSVLPVKLCGHPPERSTLVWSERGPAEGRTDAGAAIESPALRQERSSDPQAVVR